MANDFYISAGLVPIDNSTGATAQSFYISAGLVPNDTAAAGAATPRPRSVMLIQTMDYNLHAKIGE